jgi:hypothetical protein
MTASRANRASKFRTFAIILGSAPALSHRCSRTAMLIRPPNANLYGRRVHGHGSKLYKAGRSEHGTKYDPPLASIGQRCSDPKSISDLCRRPCTQTTTPNRLRSSRMSAGKNNHSSCRGTFSVQPVVDLACTDISRTG